MEQNLRILHLKTENIQRIKVVEITPQGNLVVVGGRNGQGKTSTLDSIMFALADKKSHSEMPVRNGEKEGKIELDLGEFIVTKTIKKNGDAQLEVRDRHGMPPSESPRKLLDKLVSKLTFDPIEFLRFDAKKQTEVVKSLVTDEEGRPYDFAGCKKQREIAYEERTFINRQLGDKESENKANPYNPSLPTEEKSSAEISEQLRQIGTVEAAKANLVSNLERGRAAINELDKVIADAQAKRDGIVAWISENEPKLAEFPQTDAASLELGLKEIENYNLAVRNNLRAKEIFESMKNLQDKSNALSKQIDEIDRAVALAIANAKFPVEGLGINETGVVFNGIPFAQLSGAERLKVSVAMGIALNPSLKVLLVRDGSLLDNDNLAVLGAMAEQFGCQIWIERVGDGEEVSVVIEDGMVKEDRTNADSNRNQPQQTQAV